MKPSSFPEENCDLNWGKAMKAKLDALATNNTWTLTTLPPGKSPIDNKWVYKINTALIDPLNVIRVALLPKGFTQIKGIDYYETFSSTTKMIAIHCLLAVATN